MMGMLEVSISKKVMLQYYLADQLPAVEVDVTQIHQILMNLVINASEAIGDAEGIISVSTGSLQCTSQYLQDSWLMDKLEAGLYVYLEIKDSGCGMNKVVIDKLFDPFFTTKFIGRGLGMAAVLGIVRGHKGAITVQSEERKGTVFRILLPAAGNPEGSAASIENKSNIHGAGTVLLVDDEESVREVGSEMLRELGYTVITAKDGLNALDIIREREDIDVVILDLTMPRMDGLQCFTALRSIRPNSKVIMSSGYNEEDVIKRFSAEGLSGFIQKPYSLSVLRTALSIL
jgi:CheY-like chemotaxis protein